MNAPFLSPKGPTHPPENSAAHPGLTALPLTGAHVEARKQAQSEARESYDPLWLMVFGMAIFFALIAALASID